MPARRASASATDSHNSMPVQRRLAPRSMRAPAKSTPGLRASRGGFEAHRFAAATGVTVQRADALLAGSEIDMNFDISHRALPMTDAVGPVAAAFLPPSRVLLRRGWDRRVGRGLPEARVHAEPPRRSRRSPKHRRARFAATWAARESALGDDARGQPSAAARIVNVLPELAKGPADRN